MPLTAGIVSLGCAKNLINSEQMAFILSQNGFEIIDAHGDYVPDVIVVNTCAFIESAQQEAIDIILELSQNDSKIIVAGCLPERFREQIFSELPEVDAVIGVGSFGEIYAAVQQALEDKHPAFFGDIDAPIDETRRLLSTGPGWAYIKIAEGCDNKCAYCVIPSIRGRFRSRPMDGIIDEAERLSKSGIRELILVAQDITRYGIDIYGEKRLPELLRRLCDVRGIEWIRLHYLYPDEISEELINVIAGERKILKYLDIPIQHINDRILTAMNRRGSSEYVRRLFTELRSRIPGLVLRTSVITGLPGESDAEFEELCEFLLEHKIERAGVFPYSPQDGTPASEMPNRPDDETARNRAALLTELQARICDGYNDSRISQTLTILTEGQEAGIWYGRSYAESPDVDGYIHFTGEAVPGDFVRVRITGTQYGELTGEVL